VRQSSVCVRCLGVLSARMECSVAKFVSRPNQIFVVFISIYSRHLPILNGQVTKIDCICLKLIFTSFKSVFVWLHTAVFVECTCFGHRTRWTLVCVIFCSILSSHTNPLSKQAYGFSETNNYVNLSNLLNWCTISTILLYCTYNCILILTLTCSLSSTFN
jgi:hypothetical protein